MEYNLEQSIPDTEFTCRSSDYRVLASDPSFDVIDIKADYSQKGNLMLTAVTAISKSDGSKFTNISLFSGAECFSRDDFQ